MNIKVSVSFYLCVNVVKLTLKMTTAQVVETSVTVNNNSPIQDYVHPDDQTQPFVNVVLAILSVVQYCYISFYYSANFVTKATDLTLRITGK